VHSSILAQTAISAARIVTVIYGLLGRQLGELDREPYWGLNETGILEKQQQ
jgi:hypothetical protein